MLAEDKNEGLKRAVGIPGLALTVVNFTIGVGIYALPAIIGIQLGPASIIGYLLCGFMFAAIMLCYVEIGSRIKTSGGSYAYVEKVFGPFAGFIVNWLFFLGWGVLSDAAVMNLVVDSLGVLYPSLSNPIIRIAIITVLIGLMIFVNIRDIKKSIRFVELVTIIKLIPLLGIIILGISHIHLINLRIEHLPSLESFNETAIILFFALAGFETSLNVSGEIKNPTRTVPRGILFGGIAVFIIYVLVQTIVQGVLGIRLIEFKDAPLAAVAEILIGPAGAVILLYAAAISGIGSVNGDILSSPRLLFAGAKDGLFPGYLSKIHKRYATPHLAVITYAILIFIFSVSGGFKQLAVLACGALLLIYLAVVLALIKLRMDKNESQNLFRVPGGLIIPGIAIAAILYVLSNLSKPEIVSIVVFVAVICLIYIVMKKLQQNQDK